MAAEVGTSVTGTGDPASGSIPASAKNTTTGNAIIVFVKWENPTTPTLTDVQDTAGNTYIVDQQAIKTTDNEPHGAIAYCLNATGNASNVVTANFSAATATFRRIIVHEYSGLGTAGTDGTHTNNSGNGTSYTTADITTTVSGLVFAGISGFTTLSSKTANGTPAFSLGDTSLGDTFDIELISGSGQTVSPAASSGSSNLWVMLATAFKDDQGAVINATPGTWTWAGTTAAFQRGPETAFQQNAFQSNAFQIFGGTTGGAGVTTINASPGTWSWAGSTQSVAVQTVSATPGTWNWAGSASSISVQAINATPGTWTWAGTTASTTQLINATTGTWTWAGTTASTTQLINATPGTWTWTGTTASTTQLINASPGTWTWAGTTQQITTPGGATTIDATPGLWTWAGAQASLEAQAIDATPGAFSWAGTTSSIEPQAINATPGLWSWAGTQAAIIQFTTIDATPGLWTWTGTQASITSEITADVGGGSVPAKRRYRKRYQIEVDGQVFEVRSEEEAVYLLEQLKETAKQKASEVIQRAHKAQKRPKRKILADARKALKPPEISTNRWVSDRAEGLAAEIEDIYKDAIKAIEIGALLKRQEELDDEETILLLYDS